MRSTTIIEFVLKIDIGEKNNIPIYMETIGVVCFIIFTTGTLGSIGVFVKELIQTNKHKELELIVFE